MFTQEVPVIDSDWDEDGFVEFVTSRALLGGTIHGYAEPISPIRPAFHLRPVDDEEIAAAAERREIARAKCREDRLRFELALKKERRESRRRERRKSEGAECDGMIFIDGCWQEASRFA